MKIEPISPKQADKDIFKLYKRIQNVFNVQSVPFAFQYIASFESYFKYLVSEVERSVQRSDFASLSRETSFEVESIFKENFAIPKPLRSWRQKNRDEMISIIRHGKRILAINTKLTFVFIALRESVKSWSLSGKISRISTHEKVKFKFQSIKEQSRRFIYNEVIDEVMEQSDTSGKIVKRNSNLIEYIQLSEKLFKKWQKEENYLFFRLAVEKLFLLKEQLLPNFMYSPINVVLPLVQKYPHYDELLYLLLDYFPTFTVQKLIFGLYLI